MSAMQFIKGYQNNHLLRNSFNSLAQSTFGLNFEEWYKQGYWTNRYEPFSYLLDGQIVANVSVNKLDLVINGAVKRAIQIGTVMTNPDYRNQGLSRSLMNKVLEEYKDVDFIYLFANDSVLNFYPKFGFEKVEEKLFSMKVQNNKLLSHQLRKLDGTKKDDQEFIYEFAKRRKPVSSYFSTLNAEELILFYTIYAFPENIVFVEDEQLIVFYQIEGNTLHLYDVISHNQFRMEVLIDKLAEENIEKVVLHFTPEKITDQFILNTHQGDETLFIKAKEEVVLPDHFKHPLLSQA